VKLRIHSEATEEARDAARFIENERKGYGKKLRKAIEDAFRRIKRNPRAFPRYGDSPFRKCVLQKFHYTIFFAELDELIWVAAVTHQKQQPDYWMKRSPEEH
jgi:plasmid stabilization system protein ParE